MPQIVNIGASVYFEGKDLIPTFATFVTCLVIAVEYGILIGVTINLLFLLYPSARPTVHVEKSTVSFSRSWVGKVDCESCMFRADYCSMLQFIKLCKYVSVNNTTLYFIYNKNSVLSGRHVSTFNRSSSGPLRK